MSIPILAPVKMTFRYLITTLTLVASIQLQAQQNFFFDLITSKEAANFGDVNSVSQDASGIIWMGIFGKGLAYYDGLRVKRFVLPKEDHFYHSKPIFCSGGGLIYLNGIEGVQIFDPIRQEIMGQIEVSEIKKKGDTFDEMTCTIYKGDTLIWALLNGAEYATPTHSQMKNKSSYSIYLSKNGSSFRKLGQEEYQTYGVPMMEPYGGKLILKDKNGIFILDQQGSSEKHAIPNLIIWQLTSLNVHVDDQDRFWFGGEYYRTFIPKKQRLVYDKTYEYKAKSLQNWNLKERKLETIEITEYTIPNADIIRYYPKSIVYGWEKLFFDKDLVYSFETNEITSYNALNQFNNTNNYVTLGYISSTFYDPSGTLWLGGTNGLMKVNQPLKGFKLLPPLSLRSMVELEDGYVYGFHEGSETNSSYEAQNAITQYNPKTNEFTLLATKSFQNRENCAVHHWMKTQVKDSLIYTAHCKVDIQNRHIEKMSDAYENDIGGYAINVLLDRSDRIWKSSWSSNKVAIYDLRSNKLLRLDILPGLAERPVEINDMYQRPSTGNVWLGTRGAGLFIIPEFEGAIKNLSRASNSKVVLPNSYVSAFHEDKDRNMWIGHGSGLSRISSDLQSIENYPIDPQFPEDRLVYAILPENNDEALWLSTNSGIYRFDMETKSYMDFPLNEAIMKSEFNRNSYLKTKSGYMFFGGAVLDNRTVCFKPEEVLDTYRKASIHTNPIILHEIRQFDKKENREFTQETGLQLLDEIVIEPGGRYFELRFSTTDFRSSLDNYYSYYLMGYEDTWRNAKRNNNLVRYENLPPGTYTLKLAGGILKKYFDVNQREIKIIVLPYWYQTVWANILFGLLIIGLGYLIYRYNLNRQFEKQEAIRLQDLDQLKTRLYTNITHEFRTPLTIILGVNDNIKNHDQEKGLIRRSAKNLLRLINQLLDLSKLDSGKLRVDEVKGDVVAYLQYLVESFYSMASDKKVDLSFKSDHDSFDTFYDEVKVQHIIYNLVSNAIKYTRPGGKVSVEIHVLQRGEQNLIKIKIKDTGIGIDKIHLPHIFDRFYQVEDHKHDNGNRERSFGGTGIGLALTKELIDLLKGSIQIKSEKGWGTEVLVTFPSQNVNDLNLVDTTPVSVFTNNDTKPDFALLPSKPDQIADDKPLILVVEDNSGVVTYIHSILSKTYTVEVAINGQEGINRALDLIPDIILTDVMMPEKNGYELTEVLKKDARTSHIPIVMLTAKADLSSKIAGYEIGADAYLSKPFEKDELTVRLKNQLIIRKKLQAYYSGLEKEPTPNIKDQPIENQFLKKSAAFVEEQIDNSELAISDLASSVLMNQMQYYRKLKALTGQTPTQFIRTIRLKKAVILLKSSDLNISEVAYSVGFNDPNYFTRTFKKEYGYLPGDVRK
ncbi:MAG: ATP-binding protein [Saprospiraceae bacterium]|nr:ATP-binding protein [Saprospiraceae bacterium]